MNDQRLAIVNSRTGNRQSGSALVSVLVLAVAMAGATAAVLSTSLFRHGSARALHEREAAFQAAMTGLNVALFEMNENLDLGADGVGNAAGAGPTGEYAVAIDSAFTGTGEYVLRTVGRVGPMRQEIEFVVTDIKRQAYGFFARDSISMSGSFMSDSYDSSTGTYASQVYGDHAGEQGHLRSNGEIQAGGGMIYGDATPGVGFSVTGDPSNVVGSITAATTPFVPDAYVYTPAVASSGPFSSGEPVAISAGTYRYDDFTLSGGGVATISGDVILYVDDRVTLSGSSSIVVPTGSTLILHHGANDLKISGGGVVNGDELPQNVQVFSATSGKVEISGGSSFFGTVYAPEAQFVSSGGSELFGSFVGAKATLSADGRIHVDTALGLGGTGTGGFHVKCARRVSAIGL